MRTLWRGVQTLTDSPQGINIRDLAEDQANEVERILNAPDVRDRLAAQGAEALTSTPEELGRYTRAEMQRWQRAIREAGARAD